MLGGFEVAVAGRVVPSAAWRRRRAAHLVQILALADDHRLSRDQVMDVFWPDAEPRAAANNLYQAIHAARLAISDDPELRVITLRDGVLSLGDGLDVTTDVEAFEAAAAKAQAGDRAALDEAIALYQGDLLAGDRYEAWTAAPRERIARTHDRLLSELIRRHEARGELEAAAGRLRELVEHDPLDEDAQRRLMRVDARAGRTSAALRRFDDLTEILRQELDVSPSPETLALRNEIASGALPPDRPSANLPAPVTSFIGRETELDQGARLLAATRLLTLTGTSGTGKTRLALRLALDQVGAFRDGVFFVALEALTTPELIPSSMVDALGVDPGPAAPEVRLLDHLRRREALIVLDNFEHLVSGAAIVSRLLAAASGVRILVTSRSPLRLAGEQELEVMPFHVPAATPRQTADEIRGLEAVRLFVDRARSVDPTFTLSDSNARAIAEIARRLDGLPLAIELAAARVRLLPVADLARRLADRLSELTDAPHDWPERHQTLSAAIDWSYELLDRPGRLLFERLGVFAGGAGLAEAELVCGPTSELGRDVLGAIGSLVEQSLLRRVDAGFDSLDDQSPGAGGPRFTMLPTIREYALGRLNERGGADAIRARHAEAYVALAERTAPALTGDRASIVLERLAADHDNFRAALAWAIDQNRVEIALRLVAALWRFWQMHGDLFEAGQRIDAVLALPGMAGAPAVLRARGFGAAGSVAYWRAESERTHQFYSAAVEAARASGDRATLGEALYNVAFGFDATGGDAVLKLDPEALAESLSIYRELRDDHGIANASWALGLDALHARSLPAALEHFADALAAYEMVGDEVGASWALFEMGVVEFFRADLDESEAFFDRALERMERGANMPGIAFILLAFVAVAKDRDEPSRFFRLAGAADALRARTGADLVVTGGLEFELPYPEVPAPASPERDWWDEGAAMSIGEAIALARDHVAGRPRHTRPSARSTGPADRVRTVSERRKTRA